MSKAHIGAELAGGEQRFDGGPETQDVDHCAIRDAFQCQNHGNLQKK